ncbi:nucleotide-diphospho-sugar transferase [Amylocarpus encephaloides]|uniref:Nucleotide-diphospho-sugar transferase n=1 Tax=Amylocarpus encephaloides TaxID=45428 RepID=A0A9P7YJ65_9HELO|nr:nucleotide-diphospho-sugar transferase [Amylocarpus encephaloides]
MGYIFAYLSPVLTHLVMSTYIPHKRRKSSTHHTTAEIPSFLENSPFFIPFSETHHSQTPKAAPRPTLSQLLRSRNTRRLLLFLAFAICLWYFMPRKGDISYDALGRWGLLRGGGAQCLYDPKARAEFPVATARSDSEPAKSIHGLDFKGLDFSGIDWARYAYVTYVTHKEVLCNALMMLESVKRLGSMAQRVMLIPDTEEFETEGYGSKSAVKDGLVKKLLGFAEKNYGVKLKRVRILNIKMNYQMWADSYTKLLALNMTEYDRIVVLDSDATLLQPMDELFLLPPATAAMPRAYWLETPTLASHIMLIQPSTAEYLRAQKAVAKAQLGTYDMEIINKLYGTSCIVLPHRPYALLTGEFRRPNDRHRQYLGGGEDWDAEKAKREAKLIHFSDHPMPKPWDEITLQDVAENTPKCGQEAVIGSDEPDACPNRKVWSALYREFRERRKLICELDSP